jgi:predicted transposase/invertase (TIGR01784 family)
MLLTEWNLDDAKEVWLEEGVEKGREERDMEIIHNALSKGFSLEQVCDITGLDMETIRSLSAEC